MLLYKVDYTNGGCKLHNAAHTTSIPVSYQWQHILVLDMFSAKKFHIYSVNYCSASSVQLPFLHGFEYLKVSSLSLLLFVKAVTSLVNAGITSVAHPSPKSSTSVSKYYISMHNVVKEITLGSDRFVGCSSSPAFGNKYHCTSWTYCNHKFCSIMAFAIVKCFISCRQGCCSLDKHL